MSTIDVPPAPERAPGHRTTYSSATVALARAMYGDGDSWTPTQIWRYLNQQGHPVCLKTVRRWVVPGCNEDHLRRNAAYYAQKEQRDRTDTVPTAEPMAVAEPTPPATTPYGRMRQLRDAKMSYRGIATILQLDFGLDVNVDRVRYCLRVGRCPTAPYRPRGRPRKKRSVVA